jgi:hypothetical protein
MSRVCGLEAWMREKRHMLCSFLGMFFVDFLVYNHLIKPV